MSCKLGLAIGESFAELTGIFPSKSDSQTEPFIQTRWYLPKKSLADGLKEALRELPGDIEEGELWVASHSVERILDRRQGRAPAVLVTSGFESWLGLAQPPTTPKFSPNFARERLPLEHDSVFGISERTLPDGTIATPIDREELEFIAAKLELLKIKDVAITFLNSSANPENENAAAAFLADKGFRTNPSHLERAGNLTKSWQKTIESSFAEAAISEERDMISEAMQEVADTHGSSWDIFAWSPEGPLAWADFTARSVRGGLQAALSNSVAASGTQGAALHCGLDGFSLFTPEARGFGSRLKPTQLVMHGLWTFPNFADAASGYEPGPMLFGRSHQLALLDILYLQDRLLEIEGLTPLLNEKSRPRILETLFTLAKASSSGSDKRRPPDAQRIASDLEKTFIEEIAVELAAAGIKGELVMTGPFADSLAPLIAARRKDLKVKSLPADAWRESRATMIEWKEEK